MYNFIASSAAVGLPDVVAFFNWAEAWSRIFRIAALRLGFDGGMGGGGVVDCEGFDGLEGRERRVRWSWFKVLSVEDRLECEEGVERDLVEESRLRGRRVNVSAAGEEEEEKEGSMVDLGRSGKGRGRGSWGERGVRVEEGG